MTPSRRKKTEPKPDRDYTYSVLVSFAMQFTFRQHEVQAAEEGGENDLDPTGDAIADLEEELKDYLSQQYLISGLEADTDFDDLLGSSEVLTAAPVRQPTPSPSPKKGSAKKRKSK
jgi:hypothetical protein